MSDNTVFGKPIVGEVSYYAEGISEQHDPELIREALDKVFAFPEVKSVKWKQYTPYFNDGEACVFSVWGLGIAIEGGDEEAGDDEDGYYSTWSFQYHKNDLPPIENLEDFISAVKELDDVIENGHHYVFLNQTFGDPAEVTATREGFEVEFYDHD